MLHYITLLLLNFLFFFIFLNRLFLFLLNISNRVFLLFFLNNGGGFLLFFLNRGVHLLLWNILFLRFLCTLICLHIHLLSKILSDFSWSHASLNGIFGISLFPFVNTYRIILITGRIKLFLKHIRLSFGLNKWDLHNFIFLCLYHPCNFLRSSINAIFRQKTITFPWYITHIFIGTVMKSSSTELQ